jgi:probable HAF family extracellular repeat protein
MSDLGTWPGGKQSWAAAINERGQVIVLSETARTVMVGDAALPVTRAFLWEKGRLRDLGADFGGPGSWASAINDRGQVVGQADTKAIAASGHHFTHAFLWEKGKVRDLGTLRPGQSSYAVTLNERGQVVGGSCRDTRGAPDCRAFLWQDGKLTGLGTSAGYALPDINERGQIVGTTSTGGLGTNHSPIRHAFLWQNGTLADLGTLGGPRSDAAAINDRGQVVGQANTTAKSKSGYTTGMPIGHAFLWQNGNMRDLGTLGGEYSIADAINERGQVVGVASTKTGSHPFLWSNGRMRDLGSFGGPNSEAKAVNERGQVVGASDTAAKDAKGNRIRHAFVWENGKLTDLGTPGASSEAVAINEHGQIIGWSETTSGAVHAVLWTAARGR